MISVLDAQQKLRARVNPLAEEAIQLKNAAGRVLSRQVWSPFDLPRFENSGMDGFAVRAASVQGAAPERPAVLRVVADIPAGEHQAFRISDGEAARIMTGAEIPIGADAVVPVEYTDADFLDADVNLPESVRIHREVGIGDFIRARGQDLLKGESLLEPGRLLGAKEIGLLAMAGISEIWAYRRPRVGLLSSGDELVEVGLPLPAGSIYDANSMMLSVLIQQAGCEFVHLGIAADRREAVEEALELAVDAEVDLIVSSAGVSVGAYDFVRSVVENRGSLEFWKVNVRPGKPLVFGYYGSKPFIGLPGNPVSAYVGFGLFVRPVIAKLSGMNNWQLPRLRAKLAEPIQTDGRESYFRATASFLETGWEVRLMGHQGSGNLRALVQANAFLIVPSEVKSLPIGADVEVWLMDTMPG